MKIDFKVSDIPVRYSFNVEKETKKGNNKLISVSSNGILNISYQPYEKLADALELIFKVETYNLKGIKEPLIFNPTKWIFDIKKNTSFVRGKENLRLLWNRYKDRNRKRENVALMLVTERFIFDTPQGFETSGFSNGPYLPFFQNYTDKEIEKDTIFEGSAWLNIPLNIPLKNTFRCTNIDSSYIYFEGWLSLDEKVLDFLLGKKSFREQAEEYHFSKDFSFESQFNIKVEIETGYVESANFNFDFKTTDKFFKETFEYKINRIEKPKTSEGSVYVTGKPQIIDP